MIEGLMFAFLEPSVKSVAVNVADPAVFKVALKVFVPFTNAASEGEPALLSEEVMVTVSETLVRRFQFGSTALTVTLNAAPAVRALGVPVLPLTVPGAADSPGTNNCSLENVPAPTATLLEVALDK